jgi:RNA polymerase sigma-70 factor (ECF subfamily)
MQDLIALMQAGDTAALDRLARDSGPRLLAVARRCCRSPHDAEDAVQQALEQARTSMRGYRAEGSPVAWLSTLVARSCFGFNRLVHNDPRRTTHDDVEPCSCDTPEAQAARAELGAQLSAALMMLSRTDRLAFLLAAEGATSDEIAARFALTSDAVRSRLKRARKILRAQLVRAGVTHTDGVAPPHGHEAHLRRNL